MHSIYTTPGLIIDSKPYAEAGKMLVIFTRDLGLIIATAQGIRLEKSKLRYYTQEYSFGNFSFVRGKEFWRLTSANASEVSVPEGEIIPRLALLLRRLLRGEQSHPELFDIVEKCAVFLNESEEMNTEQLKTLESLTVFRIMRALGYVGKDSSLGDISDSSELLIGLLEKIQGKRMLINQHINKALRESHL